MKSFSEQWEQEHKAHRPKMHPQPLAVSGCWLVVGSGDGGGGGSGSGNSGNGGGGDGGGGGGGVIRFKILCKNLKLAVI